MKLLDINYKNLLVGVIILLSGLLIFSEEYTIKNAKVNLEFNTDKLTNSYFENPLIVAIQNIDGIGGVSASSDRRGNGVYHINIEEWANPDDILSKIKVEIKNNPVLSREEYSTPILELRPVKSYKIFDIDYSDVRGFLVGILFWLLIASIVCFYGLFVLPLIYLFSYINCFYPLLIIFPLSMVLSYIGLSLYRFNTVKCITLKLVASYFFAFFLSLNYAVILAENRMRFVANNKYDTDLLFVNFSIDTYLSNLLGDYQHSHSTILKDGKYKYWSFGANDFVD